MKIIMSLVFCLGITLSVFSQAKEITRDESVQQLVTSFGKLSDFSSRRVSKEDFYKNGRLTKTAETIKESLKPDKSRYFKITKIGKRIEKFEVITIGKVSYCRSDSGVWTNPDNCFENALIGALAGESEAKYTVEETKLNNQNVKLYRHYIIYKNVTANRKEELTYWNYKFWVNEAELILRREIEEGSLKPKKIYQKMTETFEYDPKGLKIEAPILSNKKK